MQRTRSNRIWISMAVNQVINKHSIYIPTYLHSAPPIKSYTYLLYKTYSCRQILMNTKKFINDAGSFTAMCHAWHEQEWRMKLQHDFLFFIYWSYYLAKFLPNSSLVSSFEVFYLNAAVNMYTTRVKSNKIMYLRHAQRLALFTFMWTVSRRS